MQTAFNYMLIFLAVTLTVVILLQVKGLGSGLFGSAYSTFRTRRGFERTLFRATILLAVIFIVVAMVNVRVK